MNWVLTLLMFGFIAFVPGDLINQPPTFNKKWVLLALIHTGNSHRMFYSVRGFSNSIFCFLLELWHK